MKLFAPVSAQFLLHRTRTVARPSDERHIGLARGVPVGSIGPVGHQPERDFKSAGSNQHGGHTHTCGRLGSVRRGSGRQSRCDDLGSPRPIPRHELSAERPKRARRRARQQLRRRTDRGGRRHRGRVHQQRPQPSQRGPRRRSEGHDVGCSRGRLPAQASYSRCSTSRVRTTTTAPSTARRRPAWSAASSSPLPDPTPKGTCS